MKLTHEFRNGKWYRVNGLLITEIEDKYPFLKKHNAIQYSTNLDKSTYFWTSVNDFMPRLKHLLIESDLSNRTVQIMKSYDLVDIYFDKADEGLSVSSLSKFDLVIMFVGIAEPSNKYLPELVIQLIEGRQFCDKPTWVVSPVPIEALSMNYPLKMVNALKFMDVVKL